MKFVLFNLYLHQLNQTFFVWRWNLKYFHYAYFQINPLHDFVFPFKHEQMRPVEVS